MPAPQEANERMQPTLIFDFRNKTVSVGGSAAARKAIADVLAVQRAVIAKAANVKATITRA
jgi:hypothetical protein